MRRWREPALSRSCNPPDRHANIEQIGSQLLQGGAINMLREMIEAVPPAVRDRRPRLLYLLGSCAHQGVTLTALDLVEPGLEQLLRPPRTDAVAV